jgi:uncharacterized protein YqjF (DUF2071 family)
MEFLKNHPFAVEAHFETSLVLTFAIPKQELQAMIPDCLQLDTFNDEWAFVAVAMVRTKELRPKGFPKFMGNAFFLIGYRIFVRYTNNAGKRLRGLFIIKSETDKKKMELLGNLFTHYNYTTTDINETIHSEQLIIESKTSNFKITTHINTSNDEVELPATSPFANWKEARRFAGPMPFTFTYNALKKQVLIIEGVRENWTPTPVKVIDYNIEFLRTLKLSAPILANAFVINNIPYYWKKGKIEQWK